MDFGDLILAPLFLLLFFLYFKRQRNRLTDPLLKKYHRQGFWIKMIGCIAFVLYNVYIYPADSLGLYQTEGNNIYHLILKNSGHFHWLLQKGKFFDQSFLKNPYNTGYSRSEANFMIIRLVALFSFITAGRYAATSLIFTAIAFSGVWKLFLFFYNQKPKLHKQFAIAILYFPTFVFWSSGVSKDTICIAAVGWITYSLYNALCLRKSVLKNLLISSFWGFMLATIKIYIFISYLPFLLLFILLKKVNAIKFKLLRYLMAPTLVLLLALGFTQYLNSNQTELGKYAIDDVASSIQNLNDAFKAMDGNETAESNFNLGANFDGTTTGLIKIAPIAIFTSFYRPFIWEAHKMSQMLASVENLILLFFTLFVLFKSRPFSFLKMIISDPLIMYCFFFSIIFAAFVGASTLNFGTLVRYKIPAIPFFTSALFLVYDNAIVKSRKKKLLRSNNFQDVSLNIQKLQPQI